MLKRATYYMVECDYPHETDAQRIAFDEFYWDHVHVAYNSGLLKCAAFPL